MTNSAEAARIDPTIIGFYNAPYLTDDEFEHRPALRQKAPETTNDDKPIAIYGRAGTGKTYAAVHLAYDFCLRARDIKRETFVLWFDAKSVFTILRSFHTIALQLGLPVIDEPRVDFCELLTEWLEQKVAQYPGTLSTDSSVSKPSTTTVCMDRPFLIVLDGIESLDVLDQPLHLAPNFMKYNKPIYKRRAFRSYLPPEIVHDANWLFTTRSCAIATALSATGIELDDLSSTEAQSVCKRILGDKVAPDAGQLLSDRLCTNATVVALAAGYVRHTGITFAKYIDRISNSLNHLMLQTPPIDFPVEFCHEPAETQKPNVLVAAISHTIHLLLRYNREDTTEDTITPFVLWAMAKNFGGLQVPICWQINKLSDGGTVKDEYPALHTLEELSLTRRIRPGIFTISDVVLQASWTCFPSLHEVGMTEGQSAMLHFFRWWCPEGRGEKHVYLPLVELVLSYPTETSAHQAELLGERAEYYLTLKFYREAWRDTFAAYEIYQELSAKDGNVRPAVITLHHLAQIAYDMGEYELAQKLHQSALEAVQTLEGEDELRFDCMTDLAMTLGRLQQHTASAAMYRKAMEERKQIFGEDARFFLYKAYLGDTLRELDRVDEASDLLTQAYTELQKAKGECHNYTLTALSGIIDCLTKQQRWTEALEKKKQELKLQQELTGSNSLVTLVTMSNLALIYYEAGDKAESYKLLKYSLEEMTAKIGPKHPKTQQARSNFEALFQDRLVTV